MGTKIRHPRPEYGECGSFVPLSPGAVWLLSMAVDGGFATTTISTLSCPEVIGMATVRGLERRGFIYEAYSGIFRATADGRAVLRAFEDAVDFVDASGNRARRITQRRATHPEQEDGSEKR